MPGHTSVQLQDHRNHRQAVAGFALTLFTTPGFRVRRMFSIFVASTTASGWLASTLPPSLLLATPAILTSGRADSVTDRTASPRPCARQAAPPDEGKIFFDGSPINAPSGGLGLRQLAGQRAVFPQQSEIAFGYEVREIVAMSRLLRDGSAEEDECIVQTAMEGTGVLEFAERDARRLSGGQQARVTLARVLAQDTPILLLDEPTAALDLHYQAEVLRICQHEAARGCTEP